METEARMGTKNSLHKEKRNRPSRICFGKNIWVSKQTNKFVNNIEIIDNCKEKRSWRRIPSCYIYKSKGNWNEKREAEGKRKE